MNPPEQTTVVLQHTLHEFIFEIDSLRQDGWEFDEQSPPTTVGFMYEAQMWRNPTDIQRAAGPKLTRSEILANARAAKAAKALERAQAPSEDPAVEADESPY